MNKMFENENKKWSEEDKNYLYDVWGEIGIHKIAKFLKRSKNSIISFAEKNGLGGFLYTGAYLTTGQAASIAGVDYTTIISWIKSDKLKAKFRKINIKRVYLIDIQDFKDFLKGNLDKWTTLRADLSVFNSDEEWLINKIDADKKYKYKKVNTSWTMKQEETLISLVNKGYSNTAIADILERTPASIERRKSNLSKQGRLSFVTKAEEDLETRQFVFDNWYKLSIKEIAEALNKTEKQISTIQWRYSLPSQFDIEDNSLFTLIELGKMLGTTRDTIRRWINNFDLPYKELNKGNKKRIVVDIDDVLPFVLRNENRLSKSTYERCKSILEKYLEDNTLKEAV